MPIKAKNFQGTFTPTNVVLAMGQGRIAAAAINQYLAEKKKTKNQPLLQTKP